MINEENFRMYKRLVRTAPPAARLKMLRELSRVIMNIENTERIVKRRLTLGAPKSSYIGRRIAATRARMALKRARRIKRQAPKNSPSNIFSRLSI